MKREEKKQQTRRKIMQSALQEFGDKSYKEASLNTICATGSLSKGIIYHYFESKDVLYLACVKECFDALTQYLSKKVMENGTSVETALAAYFDARTEFFREHPMYLNIFYNVLMGPPQHLSEQLAVITADFEELNLSALTRILSALKLRADITVREVVEVFREYQDFVHTTFQMQGYGKSSLQEHEERCHRSLKILLYGIIEREA